MSHGGSKRCTPAYGLSLITPIGSLPTLQIIRRNRLEYNFSCQKLKFIKIVLFITESYFHLSYNRGDMMKIVGHRGIGQGQHGTALENTIESFKFAKSLGVDAIELDVLSTKDGKMVVCHDANLTRLSGKDINIPEINYSELAEVHLLNKETVPLLYDVLGLLQGMPVIIDLKTDKYIPTFVKILKKYPDMDITIATYHRKTIKECKKLAPHIPVFVQRAHTPFGFLQSIRRHGADGLNVRFDLLDPFTYYHLYKKGLQVQIYTVDNIYVAKLLKKLYPGIWIVTNHPDKLLPIFADKPKK